MVCAKTNIVSHHQTFDLHLRLVLIAKTERDCLSDTNNNKSTEKLILEIYLEERFEFYRLQFIDLLLILLLLLLVLLLKFKLNKLLIIKNIITFNSTNNK